MVKTLIHDGAQKSIAKGHLGTAPYSLMKRLR